MPSNPLLIHVGYHKTGTTWLQRVLFQPRFGYHQLMTHEEVFQTLVKPHALCFDPEPVKALIDQRRGGGGPGSVDVISSEILVGHPFYGGRESDEYARRLQRVAPDARILITIREQMRMMTSVYMQYLSREGALSPTAFFADDPVVGFFAFQPEHFEYHRLVGYYCDLFGVENVHVGTQESLARGPIAFTRALAAFAGVSAGDDLAGLPVEREARSYPEFSAPLLRRINQFRSGPAGADPILDLGPISDFGYRVVGGLGRSALGMAVFGKVRPVTDHVVARFRSRYVDSNRQLKALLGDRIDLSGYEI